MLSLKVCFANQPIKGKFIEFPTTTSFGTIVIRQSSIESLTVQARGRVFIPSGSLTFFTPNKSFFLMPSIASKWPADAFSVITLHLFSIDENEDNLVSEALKSLSHLTELLVLDLDRAEITDAGLCSVNHFQKLQSLSVALTGTKGRFLENCSSLKNLERLSLSTNSIDVKYLSYLKCFPKLRSLNLVHTKLTNSGLRHISNCKNLETLLIGTNSEITNTGIKELKTLKQLKELDVRETAVTPQGVLVLKGIPLQRLRISSNCVSAADKKLLQAAFPGLELVSTVPAKVDQDTAVLFGPLSRGRNLKKTDRK